IQIFLLVGVLHLYRKAVGIQEPALQNSFLLATGAVLALFVAQHPGQPYPALYQWFLPQTHVGSLIMVVLALGLLLTWIKRAAESRGVWQVAIAYTMVCFLGTASNILYFANLLVPVTVVLWLTEYLRLLHWKHCLVPVALGWIAGVAGALVNRHLLHAAD